MTDTGVAFFTYIRPEHTKKAIESIKYNNFQKLYIFQDGLKDEKDLERWKKVNELIKSIDFIETELHISDKNKGLAESCIFGINYVLEKHNTIIVLEDDNVLGKGYSEFMNECFERYEQNMEVFSISGCFIPISYNYNYEHDVFFSYRTSSTAWGTWRNRWRFYNRDFEIVKRIFKDEEKKVIFDMCGCDLINIIHAQLEGKTDSWAIFWSLTHIDNKAVCVYPYKFLAQNIGESGGGTHSMTKTSRFNTDLFNMPDRFEFTNKVFIDEEIIKSINITLNHFNQSKRILTNEQLFIDLIRIYRNNLYIGAYLKNKGIDNVIIYGAGHIAELLIEDIKNEININCILVLDKTSSEFCGYQLFELGENIDISNKAILITPVYDKEYIKFSLHERFGEVIMIELDGILKEILGS